MNLAARSSSTPASVSVPNDDCGVAADVWSLYDILRDSARRQRGASRARQVSREREEKLSQRQRRRRRVATFQTVHQACSNLLSYCEFDPALRDCGIFQVAGRIATHNGGNFWSILLRQPLRHATLLHPAFQGTTEPALPIQSREGNALRTSLHKPLIPPSNPPVTAFDPLLRHRPLSR